VWGDDFDRMFLDTTAANSASYASTFSSTLVITDSVDSSFNDWIVTQSGECSAGC